MQGMNQNTCKLSSSHDGEARRAASLLCLSRRHLRDASGCYPIGGIEQHTMKKSNATPAAKAKVLNSKTVYEGKVLNVVLDEVHEPSGVKAVREVIRHQGSAVVLPVDDSESEPRILLEEQFRYAANETLWQVPAGRVDPGESPLEAA